VRSDEQRIDAPESTAGAQTTGDLPVESDGHAQSLRHETDGCEVEPGFEGVEERRSKGPSRFGSGLDVSYGHWVLLSCAVCGAFTSRRARAPADVTGRTAKKERLGSLLGPGGRRADPMDHRPGSARRWLPSARAPRSFALLLAELVDAGDQLVFL